MFKNYLRTAFRSFKRNRVYTFINVAGLGLGIAAFILISGYVHFEKSFDTGQKDGDRIYRVESRFYKGKELTDDWATSTNGYVSAMKKNFPEVELFARISYHDAERVIQNGNIKFREKNVCFADSNFFSFFSYPLLRGNAQTILKDVNTIAVSESAAKKYFGSTDVIGKFLEVSTLSSHYHCMVSGVFKDIPANSTLQFNFLISWATMPELARDFWYQHDSYSFIKLRPQASAAAVEARFPAMAETYKTGDALKELRWAIQLVPLQDIHLNPVKQYEAEVKGSRRGVQYMYIIGIVILIIACVNYVNLTTARALERAKEVGVRKVSGAAKPQLVMQFFVESLLVNCFALVLAVILSIAAAYYVLPLLGQQHSFQMLFSVELWINILLVFLISTLLSAVYPAFVLTNIEPIGVLKGRFTFSPGSNRLRKVLVTFQFAASLMLIAGTIAVYRQLSFMNNQQQGINITQTLVIKAPVSTTDYQQKIQLFKNKLLGQSGVQAVTISGAVPGKKVGEFLANRRFGASAADERLYEMLKVDFDFIKAYQLKMVAGRGFDRGRTSDSTAIVLNESAVKQFGFASPQKAIGEKIWLEANHGKPNEIIGVVKDYHQQSLQQAYTPIILFMDPGYGWIPSEFFSVRLKSNDVHQQVAGIEQTWSSLFPESSFDYFFLDDFYNSQYKQEAKFGKTFMSFSIIAVFIACLGLSGLTAYTVSRRKKEIGVRKVLGASVFSITRLLSADLLVLIITGCAIALPLTIWLVSEWLNGYAFRASLTWWQFVVPVLLLAGLALLCISYLVFKAAMANPVKSLRTE
ncbi:ABC transporter permease [Parafilimonas sp.]|uniref:ABC transporter permease n=1 Tax=Parafilimonas sp. TaxID=1969739 RepID=UPI0039E353E2